MSDTLNILNHSPQYRDWVIVYIDYLTHMYHRILLPYLASNEKEIISFDSFCQFVYNNSSGEIVSYL